MADVVYMLWWRLLIVLSAVSLVASTLAILVSGFVMGFHGTPPTWIFYWSGASFALIALLGLIPVVGIALEWVFDA